MVNTSDNSAGHHRGAAGGPVDFNRAAVDGEEEEKKGAAAGASADTLRKSVGSSSTLQLDLSSV